MSGHLDFILDYIIWWFEKYVTVLSYFQQQTLALSQVTFKWPFPWLPFQPVLVAIATAAFAALFFLSLKFARWLYGLSPFVQ